MIDFTDMFTCSLLFLVLIYCFILFLMLCVTVAVVKPAVILYQMYCVLPVLCLCFMFMLLYSQVKLAISFRIHCYFTVV